MILSKNIKRALLASTCIAFASTLANAQVVEQFKKDSEQVVVTGKRQSYRGDVPLKSIPQSVTILRGDTLKEIGVTRLDKALELVPGVSNQNNFGGMWDAFAIRGFVGDENMPSGYLVNGYNEGRGYSGPRDASGIEKMEIVKGPGSALFGRGEPGGTVNIITKKPNFNEQGSVGIAFGSYDLYRLEGDYTNKLTDNLAFRANGAAEGAHSFRETVSTKKYTGTLGFLAKLNNKSAFTYEFTKVHQEVPFDRGVIALNGKLGTIPVTRFLGEPGDGPVKIDANNHQFGFDYKISQDWSLLLGLGYRDTNLKGFSTEAELATARQKVFTDGVTLSRQRRQRDFSTKDLLPRAELSGRFKTGSMTHHLLLGADYEKLEFDSLQLRYRPGPAGAQTEVSGNQINIFNPVYGKLPTPNSTITNSLEKDDAFGIYIQDQIDITEKIKFRIGGRYDKFKQDLTNRASNAKSNQELSEFSPMVGIVYEPSDNISLYTSYGTGFRPQTGADASGKAFAPETTKSAEVGAKGSFFNGTLTGTIAIYKMQKDNILTSDPVNSGFSMTVGKAESKGLELEASVVLPAETNLMLSYGYVDAYITKGFLDKDFGLAINVGDPLLNVAKNSGAIVLTKNIKLSSGQVVIGGKATFVDKRLGETGVKFYLPSYTLGSLFATYKSDANWNVTAQIDNIADEEYYTASYSRMWITPGSPRTAKISFGYNF